MKDWAVKLLRDQAEKALTRIEESDCHDEIMEHVDEVRDMLTKLADVALDIFN